MALLLGKFTCTHDRSAAADMSGSGYDSDIEDGPVETEAGGGDDGNGINGHSS